MALLGLLAAWGILARQETTGTEWQVAVTAIQIGSGPLGNTVSFRYLWPSLDDGLSYASALCIEGDAPNIGSVRALDGSSPSTAPCPYKISTEEGWQGENPLAQGRLFPPAADIVPIRQALNEGRRQPVLRFRLRPDGHIVPLGLTFRPRAAYKGSGVPAPSSAK